MIVSSLWNIAGVARRVCVVSVAVAALVLGLMLAWSASARAARAYPYVGQITFPSRPEAIAVSGLAWDSQSDNLLIELLNSQNGPPHIEMFDASGAGAGSLSGSDTPAGSFGYGRTPVAAADSSTGAVYVLDEGNAVLDVFDQSGAYVCQVTGAGSASSSSSECDASDPGSPDGAFTARTLSGGLAVDQASGNVYVSVGAAVDEFDSSGKFVRQLTGTLPGTFVSPGALAVDGQTGDLLVADEVSGNDVVHVVDLTTGSTIATWDGSGTPSGSFGAINGLASDDATGAVYVANGKVVDQFNSVGSFLGELTGPPGAPFNRALSVAVDSSRHHLYVLDSNGFDTAVDTFDDESVLVPDVSTGVASNVTARSATVSGSINPDGVAVSDCRFDYGTDTTYGQSTSCVETVGSGNGQLSVHADLSGLDPDTTYHYRLEASNANGRNVESGDGTLHTRVAPVISAVKAANVTPTSADLEARINPGGVDTTYHIEYGTSTAYGANVPVPDADIGSGTSDLTVSQHITGLKSGVTYHYRIVATNSNGDGTTTPDYTFVHLTGPVGLPDNRAYEQVTPVHKNGAQFDVGAFMPFPYVSSDGNRVIAASIQCLPGAQSCTANRTTEGQLFALNRTSHGWTDEDLTPPATKFNANTAWDDHPDQGTALFSANREPDAKGVFVGRLGDGGLSVIGPAVSPSSSAVRPGTDVHIMSTSDLSHVVVSDLASVLDWPFDSTVPNAVTLLEYIGSGNSAPILVGVSGGRGSTDLISQCGTSPDSLSGDGRTVIFTALGQGAACPTTAMAPVADEVLARIDESRTVLISGRSPADCTTSGCQASAPSDATFEYASADGSKVLFSSAQQLTDAATSGSTNLYLYDFDNPAGHELIDVSAGDTSGTGPDVEGVMAQSTDGSHTYFVAGGVLTADHNARGQTATAGANNLYLYDRVAQHPGGRLAFIATLPNSDGGYWGNTPMANVTPDGRFLVFGSHARLTADDSSVSGAAQIFRYDAQADRLIRLSIGERGFNDNGNAGESSLCAGQSPTCTADATIAQPRRGARFDRTMSHDGAYVFFQSPAALTPRAIDYMANNTTAFLGLPVYVQNVYEWHAGHVYLISDGKDTYTRQGNSLQPLIGTDATGSNVFFKTHDALVPSDTDGGQLDIYDARVCTSSDPCIKPPASAAKCQGDACQGSVTPAPASLAPGSVRFSGPGNVRGGTAAAVFRVRALSRRQRRRLAAGKRIALRVRVSKPGMVRARVRGRLGRRHHIRTLASGHCRARRGGTVKVRLRLSHSARRYLRHHRLRVAVQVRYSKAAGRQRAHLTLRPRHHQHARHARARRAASHNRGGSK